MTEDDCARLVNLLVATWTTGPKAYVWTQAISDLEREPANRAYAELRDSADRVTVAAFLACYRARIHASSAPRRPDPTPTCEHCRGAGYEPGPSRWGTVGGEPYEYTTVMECRCTRPTSSRRPAPVPSLLEDF